MIGLAVVLLGLGILAAEWLSLCRHVALAEGEERPAGAGAAAVQPGRMVVRRPGDARPPGDLAVRVRTRSAPRPRGRGGRPALDGHRDALRSGAPRVRRLRRRPDRQPAGARRLPPAGRPCGPRAAGPGAAGLGAAAARVVDGCEPRARLGSGPGLAADARERRRRAAQRPPHGRPDGRRPRRRRGARLDRESRGRRPRRGREGARWPGLHRDRTRQPAGRGHPAPAGPPPHLGRGRLARHPVHPRSPQRPRQRLGEGTDRAGHRHHTAVGDDAGGQPGRRHRRAA
jgi:hypothetical protein